VARWPFAVLVRSAIAYFADRLGTQS